MIEPVATARRAPSDRVARRPSAARIVRRLAGAILAAALRLAASLAAFTSLSCALASERVAVTLELPPFPGPWAGADAWLVAVQKGGREAEGFRALPGERVALFLPRREPAFVSCRAAFGSRLTRPYGALWPMQAAPDGVLRPDAAGGWALALALRLYEAGWDPAAFDFRRLARELEGRLPDPWALPPASLAPPVVEGRFRVDYLREPPYLDAVAGGLPEALRGRALIPESPWAAPLAVGPDGGAAFRIYAEPRRWFLGSYELVAGLSPEGEPSWALFAR